MVITNSHNSKETVSRLIRNAFDQCTNVWQRQEAKDYIKTAKDYGLNELAEEMQNDLN